MFFFIPVPFLESISLKVSALKKSIIDNQLVPALAKNVVTGFKEFVIHDFIEGYIGDSKKAWNDVYNHLNNTIKHLYQHLKNR